MPGRVYTASLNRRAVSNLSPHFRLKKNGVSDPARFQLKMRKVVQINPTTTEGLFFSEIFALLSLILRISLDRSASTFCYSSESRLL